MNWISSLIATFIAGPGTVVSAGEDDGSPRWLPPAAAIAIVGVGFAMVLSSR